MFTLIYADAGGTKRFPLPAGDTIIGRSTTCDLVINDRSVSRKHACFSVADSECTVTDVGSLNGIFRHNEQIASATVNDGDVIVLGRLPLRIERSVADQLDFSDHRTPALPWTIVRPSPEPTMSSISPVSDAKGLLKLLSNITGALVRPQPLSDVLERVVDLTFETITAERTVLILTSETGELVPRVVRRRGRSTPEPTTISRTIVNRVLTERVAILATDVQRDARFQDAQSIHAQPIHSFMCAPLWNQNEVIGTLYVDTPRAQRLRSDRLSAKR